MMQGKAVAKRARTDLWLFFIGLTSAASAAIIVNVAAQQGWILPPSGYIKIYAPNGTFTATDVTPTIAAIEGITIEAAGTKAYTIGEYQKWLDGTKTPIKLTTQYYRLRVTEGQDQSYVDVAPATYTDLYGETKEFNLLTGHEDIPPPRYVLANGKVFVFKTLHDGDTATNQPVVIQWKLVNDFRIK